MKHIRRGPVELLVPELADGVVTEVFDRDVYRIAEVPAGAKVLDVGAHIGCFALRCAVERSCSVVAYEPNPLTYGFLAYNVTLNGAAVEARPLAVGAQSERRDFNVNLNHPAGSGFFESVADRTIPVVCASIYQVLVGQSFDVLKFDCEGAEREIVTAEALPLISKVDRILMEWHKFDGRQYADLLSGAGYSVELQGEGFAGGLLYAQKGIR